MEIGITERGDAALNLDWMDWISNEKPAILITKNPFYLANFFDTNFHVKDINVIIHATITGYGSTIIEPNVPDLLTSIEGYLKLVQLFGADRVVLRVDPVFPSLKGAIVAKNVVKLAKTVADTRIRVSFLDNYAHVKQRFIDAGMIPFKYDFHAPIETRIQIWESLGKPEVCGEPGMECTGCISKKDLDIFGVEPKMKDFKQRASCHCLGNKVELLKNRGQCFHKCVYCYWK